MNRSLAVSALALGLAAGNTSAAPIGYTTADAFYAALATLHLTPIVHGFDTLSPGPITIGQDYDGIVFDSFDIGSGFELAIHDDTTVETSSAPNQIGTTDNGSQNAFLDADGFAFSFHRSHAVALYVQTGEPLLEGDFSLIFGGLTWDNSDTPDRHLDPNTDLFFLGIIDDSNRHTSALLTSRSDPGADIFWSADDIVTAPVPATLALLAFGLIGLRHRRVK